MGDTKHTFDARSIREMHAFFKRAEDLGMGTDELDVIEGHIDFMLRNIASEYFEDVPDSLGDVYFDDDDPTLVKCVDGGTMYGFEFSFEQMPSRVPTLDGFEPTSRNGTVYMRAFAPDPTGPLVD